MAIGLAVIFCLLVIPAFLKLPFWKAPSRSDRVIDKFELANSNFKIRAIAYEEENGGFVPGAYYVFEASSVTENDWRKIMTFRHDDPRPIDRRRIFILNENIAYVYMGWMFAVTNDGGKTWNIWNAQKDLPNWKCCNYELIDAVDMDSNGRGKMTLNVISEERGEVPFLYSRDFGRSWSVEQ